MAELTGFSIEMKVVPTAPKPPVFELWPLEDRTAIRVMLGEKPSMLHACNDDLRHLRDLLNARFPVE